MIGWYLEIASDKCSRALFVLILARGFVFDFHAVNWKINEDE